MWIAEDLRYALRTLIHHRAITIAAVLSLALGVGANTTIFTLLNGVLLRPLQIQDSDRLVALQTIDSKSPGRLLNSYPNYKDYRDRNPVFSSLLVYGVVTVNLTGRGEPKPLMAHLASGNYFSTLGVNPVIGRAFLPDEDGAPGAHPVAVLSYQLWAREFASDPAITSRTISINGRAFQIIGVAPEGFQGLNELYAGDVWVPIAMYPQLYPSPSFVAQRRYLGFSVAGRLKPGVSLEQAAAGMQVVAQQLEREYPRDNIGRRIELLPIREAALEPKTRAVVTRAGFILMIVSGLVVLIACANIASLLLARGAGRAKEITVRLAMGATRWQLTRQLLTESVLLAVVGGAAGLLLANWARSFIWSVRPPPLQRAMHFDLDGRVLAYTFAISILTGIIFGLVPALRATRRDLGSDLKERTGAPSAARRFPQSALIAGQIAFSVVALIGAGLFIRSIRDSYRIDPGFAADRLACVVFNLTEQGYSEIRGRDYEQRALEIAARTPGVLSAALSKDKALYVGSSRTALIDGRDDLVAGHGTITLTSVIWPGYFSTLGIPILHGREFTLADSATAPHAVIVNDVAAAHFWPGENPIGKIMHFAGDKLPAQVVGVARHANYRAIGEEPQPLIYLSLIQYYFPTAVVFARTEGDPAALAQSLARAMQPLDPNLRLQPESFGAVIRESMWAQRLSAGLLTVFGAMALLMAVIGIYGVVSYAVTQRVREIGVRMALGATGAAVQRMIVFEGVRVILAGLVLGWILSWIVQRLASSLLVRTDALDAITLLLIPAALAIVALAAWYLPSRRATRIDPALALRDE
jgi:predicted permease